MRLRRILSGGAITLAATGAMSLPAATAAAAAHGKSCRSETVPINVGHRQECVPFAGIKHDIATKPQAQASQLETMLMNYIEGSAGHLRKGGPALQHALSSAEPAAEGLLGPWLSKAASSATATTAASAPFNEIPAPAGQVGAGAGGSASTTISAPNGHHVTVKLEMKNTGFVDECPDPKGISIGTATSLYRQSFDAPGLPLLGVGAGSGGFQAAAKLTGYDGDDAKLKYYDADIDAEITATAEYRVLGHAVFTAQDALHIHVVLVHVVPGAPASQQVNPTNMQGVRLTGGGADALSGSGVQALIAALTGFVRASADTAYQKGQEHWDTDEACLKATFNPASLQNVAPGSAHDVQVSVADVDGKQIAMPITAGATPGSVDPEQADVAPGSPAKLSFTVSDDPNQTSVLIVKGTTDRGALLETLDATTGKLELKAVDSESGNVGPGNIYAFDLEADIPIGQGNQGSAPFNWTAYSNSGTVTGNCMSGDFVFMPVGTTPGVLSVTAITTEPTLEVEFTITDPVYTVNVADTCDSANNDMDYAYELNPLFKPIDFYGPGGVPVKMLPDNVHYVVSGWTQATPGGPWTVTLPENDGTFVLTLTGLSST